jgi:hypothetical protein
MAKPSIWADDLVLYAASVVYDISIYIWRENLPPVNIGLSTCNQSIALGYVSCQPGVSKKLHESAQATSLSPQLSSMSIYLKKKKTKFTGMKHGVSKWLILCSKCTKTHLRASVVQKNF